MKACTRMVARSAGVGSVLLLVACGSRSRLLEPTPAAGGSDTSTGGSGGSLSGGAGGAGAGGGVGASGGIGAAGGLGGTTGFSDCVTFLQQQPLLEVPHPASQSDVAPRLVPSSDDGQSASVVFVRSPLEGPAAVYDVEHATFSPWGAWPPKLGPAVTVESSFGNAPAIAVGGSSENTFALLFSGADASHFMPNVKPNVSGSPPGVMLNGGGAAFVAPGLPGTHLVGTRTSDGQLLTNVVQIGNPSGIATSVAACSPAGVVADAVYLEAGFVLATSNGASSPKAGCASPSDAGPALRIDVSFVALDGAVLFLTSLPVTAPPVALAVAPHSSGAYVVWHEASGGASVPVRWARVDVGGQVVGPFELSSGLTIPMELQATALGDRLAVAWSSHPPAAPANVVVAIRDPDGAAGLDYAIAPSFGSLTLLGSPDARKLLVGWATSDTAGTVQLLRLDCVGAD